MTLLELDRAHGPLAYVLREVGDGSASWEWEYAVDPAHFNPHGVLHGGVVMGLLDTAMGHVVSEVVVPQGRINAAAQFNIHFLLPVRAGTIRARGKVVKIGKRTAVVEGSALDDSGAVVAIATATHVLLP
ncbi:MAG TPA: PaaI family thioesterase [Polyangia bacterium]|jgi:uncharacterized protein (TIGR00369 family)|nr:PaaI family thioesterase [Polyangia bacterium]